MNGVVLVSNIVQRQAEGMPAAEAMAKTLPSAWRWLRWLLIAALIGFLIFMAMVASWSSSEAADRESAESTFAEQLARLGAAPPYIDMDSVGQSFLHTELENQENPTKLSQLHALAWLSDSKKMLQVHIPMWFVRAKDVGGNSLGLLLAAVDWDLGDLQLKLDVAALERRGPGLLMDRHKADGSRLLIWSSSTVESPQNR